MSALVYRERPADGDPAGLVVLHHGRGADEHDLLGLADVLDPGRRLHVVTPRAPLQLPGWPGHHWYVVPRVGYPDRDSFEAAYAALTAFHDELWERTGVPADRTVLGGFSMGSVMSYATGLGPGRLGEERDRTVGTRLGRRERQVQEAPLEAVLALLGHGRVGRERDGGEAELELGGEGRADVVPDLLLRAALPSEEDGGGCRLRAFDAFRVIVR